MRSLGEEFNRGVTADLIVRKILLAALWTLD